jgi:hypothetical protein
VKEVHVGGKKENGGIRKVQFFPKKDVQFAALILAVTFGILYQFRRSFLISLR